MRRAARAKQESKKLVLDDKYVGDSLKNQIDARASACNPRTRRNFADRSGESTTSKTDGRTPARLYAASQWAKDALSNIRTSEEGPSRAAMCNQLAACYARAAWWYGPGVAGLKRSLPAATR